MNAAFQARLHHSWPIWEQGRHFELGHILNSVITDSLAPADLDQLGLHHAGVWECNLKDNSLIWSGGVYDMFGLPRGSRVTRQQAVAQYCSDSLSKLELLRAYAIRRHCGFTLDIDIHSANLGPRNTVRVIAAPVREGGMPVRLHGLKLII